MKTEEVGLIASRALGVGLLVLGLRLYYISFLSAQPQAPAGRVIPEFGIHTGGGDLR